MYEHHRCKSKKSGQRRQNESGKVIEGEKGLFIAMPSRKATDGEYRDIAHPINSATRERIQNIILEKYEQVLAEEPLEESVE